MSILGTIVIYAVIWAVCFLVVLPFGARSQSDAEAVVKGTDPGAPASFTIWKKLVVASALAVVLAALVMWAVTNPVLLRYWR